MPEIWPIPVPEKAENPTYRFISYILRNVFKVSVGELKWIKPVFIIVAVKYFKINLLKPKIYFMYLQF